MELFSASYNIHLFIYPKRLKKAAKGRLLVRAATWPLCMNDTSIMMAREFKEIFLDRHFASICCSKPSINVWMELPNLYNAGRI